LVGKRLKHSLQGIKKHGFSNHTRHNTEFCIFFARSHGFSLTLVILESFFPLQLFSCHIAKHFRIARKFTKSVSWAVTRRFREFFRSIITAAYKTAFLGRWHRYERHGVFFSWNEGVCEIKMGKKSSKVDSFFQFVFLFNLSFFLRMIFIFVLVLILRFLFLSHILGGFFMPN